jgi:hypothetical protein
MLSGITGLYVGIVMLVAVVETVNGFIEELE